MTKPLHPIPGRPPLLFAFCLFGTGGWPLSAAVFAEYVAVAESGVDSAEFDTFGTAAIFVRGSSQFWAVSGLFRAKRMKKYAILENRRKNCLDSTSRI